MKTFILTLISFFLLESSFAQKNVPGYQGKKMSIGYAASVSLAATQVNSSGHYTKAFAGMMDEISVDEQYGAPLAFNVTHSVNFNLVTKRYKSFFASASFMKSACYFDSYYSGAGQPLPPAIGQMTGFGFEIGQKNYTYELAPLGFYVAKKIGANFYIADIPSSAIDLTTVNFRKQMFVNPRAVYGIGKQNILADKILYDCSLDFDILAPLFYFIFSIQSDLGDGAEHEDIARIRPVLRDAFVVRFGFSYLL